MNRHVRSNVMSAMDATLRFEGTSGPRPSGKIQVAAGHRLHLISLDTRNDKDGEIEARAWCSCGWTSPWLWTAAGRLVA